MMVCHAFGWTPTEVDTLTVDEWEAAKFYAEAQGKSRDEGLI